MLNLVIAVLIGISITFFAFQNYSFVQVTVGSYTFTNVPLYLVSILSVLTGVLMAWFISTMREVSHHIELRRKKGEYLKARKEINFLKIKVNDLEMEKAQNDNDDIGNENNSIKLLNGTDPNLLRRPSIFDRIFPNSRRFYSKQV